MHLVRLSTRNYDKMALIDQLKLAGFEESIAYTITDRVEQRKAKEWTQDMGRQEAIRQAQDLLQKSHAALDNFRTATLSTTGEQDHSFREEHPPTQRSADSGVG
jgi:hypothetical protein